MKRIYVTGASGAGSTTLAKELAIKYGIEHLDSDAYFWKPTDPPFIEMTLPSERNQKIIQAMSVGSFVISGDISVWGIEESFLLSQIDFAVFLYVPWEVRKQRIIIRDYGRFGSRIMKGGDMYESHIAFLHWASGYDESRYEGRSYRSQKEFMQKLRLAGKKTLEIETPQAFTEELLTVIRFIESK